MSRPVESSCGSTATEPLGSATRRGAAGAALSTAILLDTAAHMALGLRAQTASPTLTGDLFVWFKDLFILFCVLVLFCFAFFPNHPLQVLGEGSISFFFFPVRWPILKTNILEQACGGESVLIKAQET